MDYQNHKSDSLNVQYDGYNQQTASTPVNSTHTLGEMAPILYQ